MKKFLSIYIGLTFLVYSGFERSISGVVTDTTTGLGWQDDYTDNGGNVKQSNRENAIDYCESLNLDGKNDWRLPNIIELHSLVVYGTDSTYIASEFTYNITSPSYKYWSSTTFALREWAMTLRSDVKEFEYNQKTDIENVRCETV